MNSIESMVDLHQEIKRLRQLKENQEALLSEDIKMINEALKPSAIIKNAFSSFTKKEGERPSLLKTGLKMGVGYLVGKLLFKNTSGILGSITALATKRAAQNVVANNSDSIIKTAMGIFGALKNKFSNQKSYQVNRSEQYNNEY